MMKYLNKPTILFDIDYTIFNTPLLKQSDLQNYSLFPEVTKILDLLKENFILGIFSEGDREFQISKLKKTNIWHFFNPEDIFIETKKHTLIMEIEEKYRDKPLVVVDDKLTVLADLKKKLPDAKMVWIKRGPYAQAQEPIEGYAPEAVFEDLGPLIKYLN